MSNWISLANAKLEHEARLAQAQKAKANANPIVAKYRRVERATEERTYEATIFQVYKDGTVEHQTTEIDMTKTNVRMKDHNTKWEEYIQGAGWFRCDPPKVA